MFPPFIFTPYALVVISKFISLYPNCVQANSKWGRIVCKCRGLNLHGAKITLNTVIMCMN